MKNKFEVTNTIEAVGVLDVVDGEIVLIVDEQEIDFIENVIKPSLGSLVKFKLERQ